MTENTQNRKAAYYTLGCKLNFAETSSIGRELQQRGFSRAQAGETPDICVVNTCSVTETADKKGRQLIRRISSRYPNATIVVTGCYASLKPDEVASIPGVDIVLGSNEKLRIAEFLQEWEQKQSSLKAPIVDVPAAKDLRSFMPSCEKGDRTRYFLKVQDGCDYWCSYCTIPMARGRSRSGSISELVQLAQRTASEGGKEIVITGVNTGDFGKGTDHNFFDLCKALDEVRGIERYRISSIEPNLLTEEIVEWIAHSSRAFMPHFHIPLQAGSDKVLKLMRRRYDTALFRSRIEMVKELLPHSFIGVDVIAGARGETEEEWLKGLEFISSLPVQQLHVFPYSERPGTKALDIDEVVSQADKHRRVEALMALSDKKYNEFVRQMLGSEMPVLWEQPHLTNHDGTPADPNEIMMHGFTPNYLRVEAPYHPELINHITTARLISPIDHETVSGSLL